EGVVDPAARELEHLTDRITGGRVDAVGRAELAREVELRRLHVDGDDLARAGDRGALYDREADAATPDDGDAGPGLHLRGVQRRAEPGGDATADDRGAIQRVVGIDLHQRVLVDEHLFGEPAQVRELRDGIPGHREAGWCVARAR